MLFPFRIRSHAVVTRQDRALARHTFIARWDVAMLLLLMLILVAWAIAIREADVSGAFDGSGQFEPVGDSRKRFHVDREIQQNGVLDATDRGGRLVLTMNGGAIREYDPEMDLWRELPSLPGAMSDRNVTHIRAGNGNLDEPFDDRHDRLFARTGSGGLALLAGDEWQVISHDTQFIGLSGRPVEWSDVTSAAVSADRHLLVLGCRLEGIGLYDVKERVWLPIPSLEDVRSVGAVREIVWWENSRCFVLAGEQRLALFRVGTDGSETFEASVQSIEFPEAFPREIVDVHVTPQGTLWILDRNSQPPHQVRVSKWSGASQEPMTELEEQEIYAGLTLADLNFAMQIGSRLYACGESSAVATAGVFEYDCDLHAWRRCSTKAITATLRSLDDRSFYVGTMNSVDEFPSGENWIVERPVQRLKWGRDGEILAQLTDDRVFSLRRGQQPAEVFHAPASKVDLAQVHSAYGLDDTHILLVSPTGAVVHNTRTRVYNDFEIPVDDQWLNESGLRSAVSDNSVIFQSTDGNVHILPVGSLTDNAGRSKGFLEGRKSYSLATGAATAVAPMSQGRFVVLDADGVLHRVDSNGPTTLGGERLPGSMGQNLVPRDVAGPASGSSVDRDTAFLFSKQKCVTVYRTDSRVGQNYPIPVGEDITELTPLATRLLLASADGDLFDFRSVSDRWPPSGKTSVMLGGDGRLNVDVNVGISDNELSDVRIDSSGDLYLAGAGKVVRYSPATRRVIERWNYSSSSRVQLSGISGHKPIAVVDGRVWHGKDSKLDPGLKAATVSLFGEQLWIAMSGSDTYRRLLWYPELNRTPERRFVFFRNPDSDAKRFLDAVPLSSAAAAEGDVLVSTDAGLRVYSARSRSWYWFKDKTVMAGAELYRLGDYVLVARRVAEQRYQLAAFHVDSIQVPHDPSQETLTSLSPWWTPSGDVQAFAMDASNKAFVFVLLDSAVCRWSPGAGIDSGTSFIEIAAPGPTPLARDLKRVVSCGSYLFFAGDQVIWSYETQSHTWRRLSFVFPPGAASRYVVQSIEKDPGSEQVWCSVGCDGDLLCGAWRTSSAADPVTLKSLFRPPSGVFAGSPVRILDVQESGDTMALLQPNRVDWYQPGLRAHRGGAEFPDASLTETPTYGVLDERRVATDSRGRFWIASSKDRFPSGFRYCDIDPTGQTKYVVDKSGTVWRRLSDGVIESCSSSATSNNAYRNFSRKVTPMAIDPATVLAVYQWRNLSILLTDTGVRIYDELGNREVPVKEFRLTAGNLPLSRSGLRAFEENGSLWILRDGAFLHLAGSPDNSETVAPEPVQFHGPVEFVPFPGGRHWVRANNQWYFWKPDNRTFDIVPRSTTTASQDDLRMFVRSDLAPVAIDRTTGKILYWDGTKTWTELPAAALPSGINVDEIRWILRDGQSWWILRADRIELLTEQSGSGLAVRHSFQLPDAILSGLRDEILSARVTTEGVEFIGNGSGCRVGVPRESINSRGMVVLAGGLQWWTSRVSESPLAKQLDSNASMLFYDELQQCGWLTSGEESRFFELDSVEAAVERPAQGNSLRLKLNPKGLAQADSAGEVEVVWSKPQTLAANTRQMIRRPGVRASVNGIKLPLVTAQTSTNRTAVRIDATSKSLVSRLFPHTEAPLLFTIPEGAPLRIVERFDAVSVANQRRRVWYRAVRDDATALWTPVANLDLENSRVKSLTTTLYAEARSSVPAAGRLHRDTAVDVVEVRQDWALLCLPEWDVGWLSDADLKPPTATRWTQNKRLPNERSAVFRALTPRMHLEVVSNTSRTSAAEQFSDLPETSRNGATGWADRVGKVPNGTTAWRAVTDLVIKSGAVVALRQGGDSVLAPAGAILERHQIAVDPSLDLGWLRWDRKVARFNMSCAAGMQEFSPTELLVASGTGHRFLFEEAESLVYRQSGKPFIGNRYGVWQFSTDSLSLIQGTIDSVIFRAFSGASALRPFVHGFLDGNGAFIEASPGMPVRSGGTGKNTVSLGPAQFVEDAGRNPLNVKLTQTDGTVLTEVLSDAGFNWDRRRSVAINATGLLLHSDAGIHQHEEAGQSRYSAAPQTAGRLFSENRTTTWFQNGDEWFQHSPGSWRTVLSPRINRTLVEPATSGGWTWRRNTQGEMEVTCAGQPVDFQLVADSRTDAFFNSDVLGDAAVIEGELHVVTQAWHQFVQLSAQASNPLAVGTSLNQRSGRQPLPADTAPGDIDLEVLRNRHFGTTQPGEFLFRFIRGRVSHWDRGQSRFESTSSADDPRVLQRLATTSRLSFWLRDGARLQKDIRLNTIDGNEHWTVFSFTEFSDSEAGMQIRFPFDRVCSATALFGRLFVGTDCGLQIVSQQDALNGKFDLHEPGLTLLEVRKGSGSLKVDRVGVPFANARLLAVRSDSQFLTTSDGKQFVVPPSRQGLDERLRLQNSLWQWREEVGAEVPKNDQTPLGATGAANVVRTTLAGRYINSEGAYSSERIDFTEGRLPHDRIFDATYHQGKSFTLWNDGWVTIHVGGKAELDTGFTNFDLREIAPADLFLVEHSNLQLTQGLYLRNQSGSVWRFDGTAGGSWMKISTDEEAKRLVDYATNRPVFSQERLRLMRTGSGSLQFQHRTLPETDSPYGKWRELPWVPRDPSLAGTAAVRFSLACDLWQEFIFDKVNDVFWVASPMGFCRFSRIAGVPHPSNTTRASAPGRAELRPDQFVAAREHADAGLPPVTEIRMAAAGVSLKSGQIPIEFRLGFSSQHVYAGTLAPGSETGLFTRLAGTAGSQNGTATDPFAVQQHVSTDFWQWTLTGRAQPDASDAKRCRPGQVECRFLTGLSGPPGERIELNSGRFPFDLPDSLFADGAIVHFASADSDIGWLTIIGDDLHLRHWKRAFDPAIARTVRRVFPARMDNGQIAPGLRFTDGRANTVVGNRAVSIAAEVFAGEDGFWTYRQRLLSTSRQISSATSAPAGTGHASGLLIDVSAAELGIAHRVLQQGKFTDDIVAGLPVLRAVTAERQSADAGGFEYFIPTLAGIECRTTNFGRRSLRHPVLSMGAAPTVVYLDSQQKVHYLVPIADSSNRYQLVPLEAVNGPAREARSIPELNNSAAMTGKTAANSESGAGFSPNHSGRPSSVQGPPVFLLPRGTNATGISRDQFGSLHIHWISQGGNGWMLAEPTADSPLACSNDTLRLSVAEWRRFRQNWAVWGNPEPVLTLRFDRETDTLLALATNHAESIQQISIPREPPVRVVVNGSLCLLVTKQGVYRLELNLPLVKAFRKPVGHSTGLQPAGR